MSIIVGKMLVFVVLRIVDGEVKVRGVIGLYELEVWVGVLSLLEGVGVVIEEKWYWVIYLYLIWFMKEMS